MRTRWILFFCFIFPVWKLCQRLPYLSEVITRVGSIVLVMWASYLLAQFLWSKLLIRLVDSRGKAVLVTGCDSGFGNLLAKRLSREGFFVYAGCLDASGDGALDLSKFSNVHILQMNVTKDSEMEGALELVKNTLGSKVLWAVVANAGISRRVLVELESMHSIRKTFEVNVFGTVRVCKMFLPMLRKSRGRLVLVSSVLGRTTLPGSVSYSMTKHAVNSLADGLRRECFDQGVHVATIEPTLYNTNIVPEICSLEEFRRDLHLLPREVQEEYSEREVLNWVESSILFRKLMCRMELNEVIDQMVLAIRESDPRPYYCAWGPLDPIIYFVSRNIPAEFMDTFIIVSNKMSKFYKLVSHLRNP